MKVKTRKTVHRVFSCNDDDISLLRELLEAKGTICNETPCAVCIFNNTIFCAVGLDNDDKEKVNKKSRKIEFCVEEG